MRRLLQIIRNQNRLIIIAAVFLAASGFLLFSNYGIIKRIELIWEKSNLAEEINKEKRIRDSLEKNIKKTEYDLYEVERLARERYGMIKSGEKIYIIKK